MADNVDYKAKYEELVRDVDKFVKANNAMVEFLIDHLMPLADKQIAEYEELVGNTERVSL